MSRRAGPLQLAYLGMLLRLADPDDAIAIARVHIRSWQVAYQALLPEDFLAQLRPEDRASRYDFETLDPQKPRTIVAVERGTILGFATTAPSREPDLPNHGELCALHVDPQQWGRGIGLALISSARVRLWGLGYRNAALWVLAGNVRAERFYQADHWAADGVQRTDCSRGTMITETRYRRELEARHPHPKPAHSNRGLSGTIRSFDAPDSRAEFQLRRSGVSVTVDFATAQKAHIQPNPGP